jgi:hypothetical protein
MKTYKVTFNCNSGNVVILYVDSITAVTAIKLAHQRANEHGVLQNIEEITCKLLK